MAEGLRTFGEAAAHRKSHCEFQPVHARDNDHMAAVRRIGDDSAPGITLPVRTDPARCASALRIISAETIMTTIRIQLFRRNTKGERPRATTTLGL